MELILISNRIQALLRNDNLTMVQIMRRRIFSTSSNFLVIFFRFWSDCEVKAQLILSPVVVDLQRGRAFKKFVLMDKEAGHNPVSISAGFSVKKT